MDQQRSSFTRLLLLWPLILALTSGCGGSSRWKEPVPPPEGKNLQQIAACMASFLREQKGRPPKNEAEFRVFIQKGFPQINLENLLVSPRDHQPYIIYYRPLVSKGGPGVLPPVMAHERTGVNGKRLVVYAGEVVEEIDETKFKKLVPELSK